MADEATVTFLRRVGLNAYIDTFKDNGIKFNMLADLASDAALGELIGPFGPRMTFKNKVQELPQNANSDIAPESDVQIQVLQTLPIIVEDRTNDTEEGLPNTFIKTLSEQSVTGLLILQVHRKKGQLDQHYRNKLAKLILKSEYGTDPETE